MYRIPILPQFKPGRRSLQAVVSEQLAPSWLRRLTAEPVWKRYGIRGRFECRTSGQREGAGRLSRLRALRQPSDLQMAPERRCTYSDPPVLASGTCIASTPSLPRVPSQNRYLKSICTYLQCLSE